MRVQGVLTSEARDTKESLYLHAPAWNQRGQATATSGSPRRDGLREQNSRGGEGRRYRNKSIY